MVSYKISMWDFCTTEIFSLVYDHFFFSWTFLLKLVSWQAYYYVRIIIYIASVILHSSWLMPARNIVTLFLFWVWIQFNILEIFYLNLEDILNSYIRLRIWALDFLSRSSPCMTLFLSLNKDYLAHDQPKLVGFIFLCSWSKTIYI